MFKSRDFTKKRLKIPKGQSVSEYRRTDNTMAKPKMIQQELIFIEKDRTNIPERTNAFILKEFKIEH
jgi:ribosomal protein L34E